MVLENLWTLLTARIWLLWSQVLVKRLLNPTIIVCALPGNPGLGAMYEDFMITLSECLDDESLSIWIFSYVGHDTLEPSKLPTGRLSLDSMSHCMGLIETKMINNLSAPTYDLEDQIEHKIALLKKFVPRTAQLTLIGHSIGCKVCMEIFRRNNSHAIRGLDYHWAWNCGFSIISYVRCLFSLPYYREHGEHPQGPAGAPLGDHLQTPGCDADVCS